VLNPGGTSFGYYQANDPDLVKKTAPHRTGGKKLPRGLSRTAGDRSAPEQCGTFVAASSGHLGGEFAAAL